MSKQHIDVTFKDGFNGVLKTERGQIPLGKADGGMTPYNLLLGGLASCLYATFLEIAEKKKIIYDTVDIAVDGVKREEVPTTLNKVHVHLKVTGASDENGLVKALDLSAKYCSIYQTLKHVADMSHDIEFV